MLPLLLLLSVASRKKTAKIAADLLVEAMADMSPMAEEDSPSSVIHKRELAEDTDGDALSPQKRPLNNNNNDVATVFLIDASDVNDDHDPHDESAVEVDEVIS